MKQYSEHLAPNISSDLKQYSQQLVQNKPKETMSLHSHYQEPTLPMQTSNTNILQQSITAAAIQSYQQSSQNLLDVQITNNQSQYQGFFIHPNSLNYATNM